jgi:hypothetical protein
MNRIAIATILGVIAGAACMLGLMSMGVRMTAILAIWILLNRTVMGFVIGISGLRLHWAFHGPLMGLIVGSIFSYAAFLMHQPTLVVAGTLVGSLIFGFLIELFTTVVFKRPQQQKAPAATKPPAMAA